MSTTTRNNKKLCVHCNESPAVLRRPRNGALFCRTCFLHQFEEEIHHTITSNNLFTRGDLIALGASGGKDSTVLIEVMTQLNARYDYGVKFVLLSIDEGIVGYRDDSLVTVGRNKETYQLPLTVLSYKELYGWSMDEIVSVMGTKSNCTFCGVFRRQALDRGAAMLGANKIATGHNADDVAETVLMNLLRADGGRLQRCTSITTDSDGTLPRVKPLKYAYEKEIVMYAYHKKLDYFVTECSYSTEAFRGNARVFIKDLEALRSESVLDILHSGEELAVVASTSDASTGTMTTTTGPNLNRCDKCGYMTSQKVCRACVLLALLERSKARVTLQTNNTDGSSSNNKRVREGGSPMAAPPKPIAGVPAKTLEW
eukprot:PhM_4_TR1233/c0_g1_i1/m.76878/K14168/CTU1, NCS6; cytoplasmic tRNA 2-thiolation protein 1